MYVCTSVLEFSDHLWFISTTATLAARDTIFDCLVEDHILFFQPFLRLLNLAYQEFGKRVPKGKCPRRSLQPTRQMIIDEELVWNGRLVEHVRTGHE